MNSKSKYLFENLSASTVDEDNSLSKKLQELKVIEPTEEEVFYSICQKHNLSKEFADKFLFQDKEDLGDGYTMVRVSNKYINNILNIQNEFKKPGIKKSISLTKTINSLIKEAILMYK